MAETEQIRQTQERITHYESCIARFTAELAKDRALLVKLEEAEC